MSVSSTLGSTGSTSSTGLSASTTTTPGGAPVTFSGIASGLDTTSIIQKLLQAAQQPITDLQTQQATLQNQEQVYAQLSSNMAAISTAANNLTAAGAFSPIQATSSNTAVATITTATGATAGNYNLTVSQLAQAEKVASNAYTDTTSSLQLAGGTFVINGQAVTVDATDSLQSIAGKINSLSDGVTASLIDGGTGNAYLTLTSQSSGVANQIQMADLTGSTLSTLGLVGGAAAVRDPSTNAAASYTFSSSSTPLSTLLGGGNGTTDTFQINGGSSISVDLDTDSLQSVADKINAAGNGVTASVTSVTTTSASGVSSTGYQLNITSPSGVSFTDPNNLLQGIGVLQQAPTNSLVSAQDAHYTLDTIPLTSSSNTITSAIPGATLTLLQGSTTPSGSTTPVPSTSTLSLTQDNSTIESNIQGFTTAFNTMADYISQNSTFNSTTLVGGALFGDPVAQQASSELSSMVFSNVSGLTGSYTNLASIGFTFSSTGDLQVDNSILGQALSTDPSAVAAIFQATGTSSSPDLSYVSSTSASVASGTGSYAVNITQPATRQTYTAQSQSTSANPETEDLAFSGLMFGSNTYYLALPKGATLSSIVSQINSDSTLKNDVVASDQNGYLTLQSKLYGASGNFTVTSSEAAGTDNSGVGNTGGGTTVAGLDVAGTINGEPATGNGQFLSGNTGNKTTDGLQVQYTGTATGDVGSISFSSGIAVQMANLVTTFTDPTSGLIAAATDSLTKQSADLQTQINNLNAQVAQQQTTLQTEFNNMETAIAAAQQQSTQITNMFSSVTGGTVT